ncbi:MAG: Poly(hydroxyalcanoate) granule associated protein (phasin) [Pelotomaculum sp. PtaB.Bin104]|nr:MAG: Poly(hydroxyalcanoate) granule associated protein (phasin) [Pelotomaculum sp. PtaB.Bin104]
MIISDEMKKIFLAGIGAMVTTAEKTKEFIDVLIEKGELTVEQGKIFNEELKRNLTVNKQKASGSESLAELLKKLDTLSPEEISALKAKLAEMEKKSDEQRNNG